MSDEAKFHIELPGVLYTFGGYDRADLFKSSHLPDDHPGMEFVRWFVQRRGLVLLAEVEWTQPGSETFHQFGGRCIRRIYGKPEVRLDPDRLPREYAANWWHLLDDNTEETQPA